MLVEPLTKSFEYAENVITVLKARGHQPKGSTGFSLDGDNAKSDFLALRSAMITVLKPLDIIETAKIFDLDLAYTLNVYNSTARQHPYFDGRALLLRLHFEVEGVQRGDRGRFMEDMRPLRLNEREGPQPTLDKLRELGDERRVYYNDFTDKDLVETFLVVIEKSTNVSPYEAPLYQHVIEDLSTAAATPAFDTVVLRVRRIWQREGVSRLARFPSPTPPDSGGDGWTRRPASGGARAMALRAAYVQEAL
eukprot:gene10148-biopygen10379